MILNNYKYAIKTAQTREVFPLPVPFFILIESIKSPLQVRKALLFTTETVQLIPSVQLPVLQVRRLTKKFLRKRLHFAGLR